MKAGDRYEKDPNHRVQEAISLIFDKVLELSGSRQALLWFHKYDLDLPVKGKDSEPAWRCPNYASIHRMIENSIYGGAYACDKTTVAAVYDASSASARLTTKRSAQLAPMPDVHGPMPTRRRPRRSE